jgi:hypothetical protein
VNDATIRRTKTARRAPAKRLATVWLLTVEGRERFGTNDAAAAWATCERIRAAEPLSRERMDRTSGFNPVEINIHPDDVDRAVVKWERVAGRELPEGRLPGVCFVEWKDRAPGMTPNEVFVF